MAVALSPPLVMGITSEDVEDPTVDDSLPLGYGLGQISLPKNDYDGSEPCSTSFLMTLPDEVIAEVFHNIIKDFEHDRGTTLSGAWIGVTEVCKRFHSIARNFSYLWSYIDLTWPEPQVAHCLRMSKELPLTLCGRIYSADFEPGTSILDHPDILVNTDLLKRDWTSLNMSLRRHYSTTWPALLDSVTTRDLTSKINLSRLIDFYWKGHDELFMKIDRHFLGDVCPKLTILNLDCIYLVESSFQFPVLEKLTLRHVWYASLVSVCQLLEGSPNLQKLILEHVHNGIADQIDDVPRMRAIPMITLPQLLDLILIMPSVDLMDLLRCIPFPRTRLDIEDQLQPLLTADTETAPPLSVPQTDIINYMTTAMQALTSVRWTCDHDSYCLTFEEDITRCAKIRELWLDGVILPSHFPEFPALRTLVLKHMQLRDREDLYHLLRMTPNVRSLEVNRVTLPFQEQFQPYLKPADKDNKTLLFSQLERIVICASLEVITGIIQYLPPPIIEVSLEELYPGSIWQHGGGACAFHQVLQFIRRFWLLRAGEELPLQWNVCDHGHSKGYTGTRKARQIGQWNASMSCSNDDILQPLTASYTRHKIIDLEPLRGSLYSLEIRVSKLIRSDVGKIIFNVMKKHAKDLQRMSIYETTKDKSLDEGAISLMRNMLTDFKAVNERSLRSLQWCDYEHTDLEPHLVALVHDGLVLELLLGESKRFASGEDLDDTDLTDRA